MTVSQCRWQCRDMVWQCCDHDMTLKTVSQWQCSSDRCHINRTMKWNGMTLSRHPMSQCQCSHDMCHNDSGMIMTWYDNVVTYLSSSCCSLSCSASLNSRSAICWSTCSLFCAYHLFRSAFPTITKCACFSRTN